MSKRTLRRAAERTARKADSATVQASTTSAAQLTANRENAQLSRGPVTPQGKAVVSQNRRTHGLAGNFTVLPWESSEDFQLLKQAFYAEHQPQTDYEHHLVDSLIQHYWLKERAVRLQEQLLMNAADPTEVDGKKLSLFLRYQSTHERSYYKAERELQNLKKEKAKQQIGFESQNNKAELLPAQPIPANSSIQQLEGDAACGETQEMPLDETRPLTFDQLEAAA